MPRLAEPPRCACPKCGYDLRGVALADYRFACPECGTRTEFWLLEQLGGRPKWHTALICIGWGVVAVALSIVAFFVVGRWTIVIYLLAMLSDAPQGPLPPLHLYLLGVIAMPVALSGVPIFLLLRRSYRRHGWPEPSRRARWRTVQALLIQLGIVTLVVVATVLLLVRR